MGLTCWLVLWVLLGLLGFDGCNLWCYGLLGLCFGGCGWFGCLWVAVAGCFRCVVSCLFVGLLVF